MTTKPIAGELDNPIITLKSLSYFKEGDVAELSDQVQERLSLLVRRVSWFDAPEKLMQNSDRFLCYFMQYCLASDIPTMRKYYSQRQFRHALDHAPPGILDARSHAYWNLVLDSNPP